MKLTRSLHRQLALPVIASVLWYGCGGGTLLKSFRIALASSGPLVNSLAASGLIPQAKAAAIIADFSEGAGCADRLATAFNAIPKELPANEIKLRKFEAARDALTCFRAIINRQNFAANSRIQSAANIAEGILASLVAFYSPSPEAVTRGPNMVVANSEKELEERLKVKVKALEAALNP